MKLLKETELEWSSVVANNAMNRERVAFGINSYEKEINFDIRNFILNREAQKTINWIDICCGTGNAVIQIAKHFEKSSIKEKLIIEGLDLVEYFSPVSSLLNLTLNKGNIESWNPTVKYDLITIIHGLHYVGDKLAAVEKCIKSLKPGGLFIANLSIENIKISDSADSGKTIKKYFSENQIEYSSRKKLIQASYNSGMKNCFIYIGANDKAGPNYTGQPVVDSYYEFLK